MRIIVALAIGIIIAGGPALWYFARKGERGQVMAERVEVTATPSPVPEPTPEPTEAPTAAPTRTPVPQPTFTSQQINEFIDRFAGQYGVSPDLLRHIALCESGFNPLAKNGPNVGLYQFVATTWANRRKLMNEDSNPDLRYNAEEAVQTAAYVLHINDAGIWPNCVR